MKSGPGSRKSDESSATDAGPSTTHVLHSSTDRQAVSSSVLLATAQVIVVAYNREVVRDQKYP